MECKEFINASLNHIHVLGSLYLSSVYAYGNVTLVSISCCEPKQENPKILWNLPHNLANVYGSHYSFYSNVKVI